MDLQPASTSICLEIPSLIGERPCTTGRSEPWSSMRPLWRHGLATGRAGEQSLRWIVSKSTPVSQHSPFSSRTRASLTRCKRSMSAVRRMSFTGSSPPARPASRGVRTQTSVSHCRKSQRRAIDHTGSPETSYGPPNGHTGTPHSATGFAPAYGEGPLSRQSPAHRQSRPKRLQTRAKRLSLNSSLRHRA